MQRIEADVDARQASGSQRLGVQAQRGPVGGEGDIDAQPGKALDQARQMCAHQGLAAGQTDALEAEPLDAHLGEALDLPKLRISDRGSHVMPSAGMQYWQRKLQRSVTEMRRSPTMRPNGSMRSSARAGATTPAAPFIGLSVPSRVRGRLCRSVQQQHVDRIAGPHPVAVGHDRQRIGLRHGPQHV